MTTAYDDVHVPSEKSPEELSTDERRAAILSVLRDRGYPRGVKQERLADYFGVHQSTISRDIDTLRDEIAAGTGDHADVMSDIAYKRMIRDHLNRDELEKARRALDSYNSWLQSRGYQQRAPKRVEQVQVTPSDLSQEELEEIYIDGITDDD